VTHGGDGVPREAARVELPTPYARFDARAFECPSGHTYLALVAGDIAEQAPVLTRIHSECLTGDALGSLRCDCGVQLRDSLRAIGAEGCGVLVYATGHEGRGIGLVNKLRAYVQQDRGSDTVDANLHLGLPVDRRDYREAASVLRALGVARVTLMTNNPAKVRSVRAAGVEVDGIRPVPTAAHERNVAYLRAKEVRLGHAHPNGHELEQPILAPPDVSALLGDVRAREDRPFTIVKYAQSIDGRIATVTGDSKWISGRRERSASHALRARCDAIMVGVGTVMRDDPQLTVRMVPGASPLRVVLDSNLRIPLHARLLGGDAPTLLLTTEGAPPAKVQRLRAASIGVRVLPVGPAGIDLHEAMRVLRTGGVQSLLVEGGARVITSFFAAGLVDRVVVALAPLVLGRGLEGIGDLGVTRVQGGIRLTDRRVHLAGDDVLMAWAVERPVRGVNQDAVAGATLDD
jgi:GTP cyclohydrolase II